MNQVPRLSKRSPKAALVELQSTTHRILELEQTHARQVAQAGTEPVQTVQPTEDDTAEFLKHTLETSHSVLRSSYVRWRQRRGNTKDSGRGKDKDEEEEDKKEAKKRKREADDAACMPSIGPKRPSTQARKQQHDNAEHDKNPMSEVLVIIDSDDDATTILTSPEKEPGRPSQPQTQTQQDEMPASAGPASLPPAPPPTPWDRLPDAMKLILVKELTSWYRYRETTLLLRLDPLQECAFRDLYAGELEKQKRFETAIRAKLDARDRDLFGNRPYTSLNRPAPSHARAEAEAQEPTTVPPLELLTDYITVQNMKMGEDYLVAVGFDRDWVDLGHWIGHTGTARFEIEMDQMGHHQRVCEAGSQGTSSLQRQPPVWPSRTLVQAQAQAEARAQAQAEARARPQPRQSTSRQSTSRRRSNRSTGSSRRTTGTSLQPPALAGLADPVESVAPVEQPPTQKRGRGRPRIISPLPAARRKAPNVTGCRQKETAVHTQEHQEPQEPANEQGLPVPASSHNSDEDGEYELE